MSQNQIDILKRALNREKSARKSAEKILEDKSRELYFLSQDLKTANSKLENLLNEKSSQLQGVFENINDAYLVIDMNGNVLKMNDVAEELFGIKEGENQNILKSVLKEDLSKAIDSFDVLMDTGFFTDFKARILDKNREIRWVQVNGSLVYDKDKNPIAAQGILRDITKQKEAQRNLMESENRLSTLILNLESGVLLEDENRHIMLTNKKFCNLFKIPVTPESLKGTDCTNAAEQSKDLFKNPDRFVTRINELIKNKKVVLGDELNMVDGVILERDFIPIYSDKEYQGHLWSYRDVTEDRKRTVLIKEQKDQLDVIVENSSFGIVLSLNGVILRSNTSFQDLLGYNAEELKSIRTEDITHPSDRMQSKKLSSEMNSGKLDKFTIEKKYLRKDGSIIWAKTTVNAVRNEFGKIKYQVALVEDRTLERENELMLQVINDVAKAILGKIDTADIAWEIVNEIAEYLGTNDCVIYLLNEQEQQLEQIAAYGKKVNNKEVVDKIILPLGQGIVGHVAKTGIAEIIADTTKDERYIVDDDQRHSEITVPIISDGKVIGIIDSECNNKNYFHENHLSTLTNIARLVSMQLANAISLEQKRKAEESNKQLLRDLEESNIELEEYAHVVSHDLKSPLRSINALVSWIKEDNIDKLDEDSLNNIDLIETTLENMEQLISDVLDYSSVTNDNLSDEIIDLNDVMEAVVSDVHLPKNVSINILNKLPRIHGDKTRFKQLFQNLISNAIKYNDKQEGFVNINYSDKKTHHKFSIEDNGMGIEKKYFDKIFEMFQSLHVSKESTGVGLSIVKKIIKLYNGDIWLESEVGKGSTFHFTIKKQ